MENDQDIKKKDKPIPEEELFDELDAMYQRVADIEKEEATETLPPIEPAPPSSAGTPAASEKSTKKKPARNKSRFSRPMILGGIAILLALILGVTFWKSAAILQLLRIGDIQQPAVSPRPAPRKPSAVVTPKTPPAPPAAAATLATPAPPAAVTSPPAPPAPPTAATVPTPSKPPSESVTAQTKQEAVKSPREEAAKAKPVLQENPKPDNPAPEGRFYALQVGSFREMENVRNLVENLKKEGLDAYWIASKSKQRGNLYKVFVGQFMDTHEAARFLRDNKILKNYPDSFIQEVSSTKVSP